jgi:hypothetical protein
MSKNKKAFECKLTFSPEALQTLVELQKEKNLSCIADVIRESVGLYKIINDKKKQGYRVIFKRYFSVLELVN